MWAVPAICFMPVVYAMLLRWLGERENPDARTTRSRALRRQHHRCQPPAAATAWLALAARQPESLYGELPRHVQAPHQCHDLRLFRS